MAEETFEKVEKDEGGFEVEELSEENLEDVSGGAFSASDPGNGCVNNAEHC